MNRFDEMEKKALCDLIDRSDKTLSNYSYSYYAEGGEVWNFEKEFARWLGRKYCVTCNSGTSALFIAIKALSYPLERPSTIRIPAYTFVADAEAVLQAGNYPLFLDINKDDYCIDEKTDLNNIIIPVHTLGNVCTPERMEIGKSMVIEDTAQCVGGKWKGKKAGTFGDISIFSGQGSKNLTGGEMGWCCTDDEELFERMCAIRNHADMYKHTHPNKKYPYLENLLGYNLRTTELSACVARCQLKKLPKFLKSFEVNAKHIFDLLPTGIEKPYYPKEITPGWFILGCMYYGKHRDKFLENLYLLRKKAGLLFSNKTPDIPGSNQPPGRSVGSGYKKLLYEYPLYKKYTRKCPNAEFIRDNIVWFDLHRFSTVDYIEKNMSLVKRAFREVEG